MVGRTHISRPVYAFTESPAFLLPALPKGSGTVTSAPTGIVCTRDVDAGGIAGTCAENLLNGDGVTLTAAPLAR